jgi:cell division septum initiation protein DivIVA
MSESPAQVAGFEQVRRGYDRQQVDAHLRALQTRLAELRQAHRQEHQRADWVEKELREARELLERRAATVPPGAPKEEGFGFRVEKLLRTAEDEAAEVRNDAAREAAALLDNARSDAERHRQTVEQSLVARAATLEQEAAQRRAELDGRERQISEQAAASQAETDRVLAEVRRHVAQVSHEAQTRVEQERARAEQANRERQEMAEKELERLRSLHDEVRRQLAHIYDSLTREFATVAPEERPSPARQSLSQRPAIQQATAKQAYPSADGPDRAADALSIERTDRLVAQPMPTEQRSTS